MGISVMAYRAAIGSFAFCGGTSLNIGITDYVALNAIFGCNCDLRLLLLALTILLIIGQVESNPGPPKINLDDLHALLLSTKSSVEKMQTDIKDNSKVINKIDLNVSETNKSLLAVTKDLQKAKSDISVIQKQNSELKKTVQSLDLKLRKNNIVFYGFANITGETNLDLENNIIQFAHDVLSINITNDDIESCYRVGKNYNKPRPILVRFTSYKTKASLFKNVKNLKSTEFAISDDLTPAERHERGKLIKFRVRANKLNLRTKLFKNMLMIENVKYSLEDLEDPDLLETIKNNIVSLNVSNSSNESQSHQDNTGSSASNKRPRESNNTPPDKTKEPRFNKSVDQE
jgi:hypothetical protein